MKSTIAALLCICLSAPAAAQQQQSQGAALVLANQGAVGVITGMEGGTYARTGADLTILDGDTLRVLPTLGKGSLQNLSDILYLKGIDIGFVQADALTYAKQHNLFPGLTQNIRYIAKLYDEEVHVLARKDMTRLEDLGGQRVNVDVAGSGSAMTAEILFGALGINAKLEHQSQVNGVQELEHGDIAAIVHVGGAPIPLIAGVPADSQLHFLPVALTPALAQTYLPAQLTHNNYPSLVADGASTPTIAVGDVMAVFAWAPDTARYKKVTRFVDAFFSRFSEFQQPPRHPKWREVNLTAEMPGWVRFQPAEAWLAEHLRAGTANAATQTRFNEFLSQAAPDSSNGMTDTAKVALFRQLLVWDRQQAAAH